MLRLKKVAVTGLPAVGKTTVCRFFEELGAYVVYTDKLVHQFLSSHNPIAHKVIELLGEQIVVEGQIDRQRVAKQVFEDPEKLKQLEGILHPEVQKELESHYLTASNQKVPLFIAEIPLLYEAGFAAQFDVVLVVIANEQRCEQRMNQTDYQARKKRMLPQEEKIKRADYVIENNGEIQHLNQSVKTLFNQLVTP